MKKLIIGTFFMALSVNAFSAVELYYKLGNEECHYANGKAVKTISKMKGEFVMSTSREVSFTGLEEVAKKAAVQSSERDSDLVDFELRMDGQSYNLHHQDSGEAMVLMQMLVSACK